MIKIPTIVLHQNTKNNFRDRVFIQPYLKNHMMHVYKYNNFSKQEIKVALHYVLNILSLKFNSHQDCKIKKALFLKTKNIGDAIILTASIAALPSSYRYVDVICLPHSQSIFRMNKRVRHVFVIPRDKKGYIKSSPTSIFLSDYLMSAMIYWPISQLTGEGLYQQDFLMLISLYQDRQIVEVHFGINLSIFQHQHLIMKG